MAKEHLQSREIRENKANLAVKRLQKRVKTAKLQREIHSNEVKNRRERLNQTVSQSPESVSPRTPDKPLKSSLLSPLSLSQTHLHPAKPDSNPSFSLQNRTVEYLKRSEFIKGNYCDKLRFHIRKVENVHQNAVQIEAQRRETKLFDVITKGLRTGEIIKFRERSSILMTQKAKKEMNLKVKRVTKRKNFIESKSEARLKSVENLSLSRVETAKETWKSAMNRVVTEKQANRNRKLQEWEGNYSLQCELMNETKTRVLAKEMRSFEVISQLQQERNRRLEAKLRKDFLKKDEFRRSLRQ